MPHTTTYNPQLRVIEIKTTGSLALHEYQAAAREAEELAKQHDCFLVLSDLREAENNLSIFDLHKIPEMIENTLREFSAASYKRALVVPGKYLADYKFFEATSSNQGQRVKIFQSMEPALQWLYEG